jgi:hypothetical protein
MGDPRPRLVTILSTVLDLRIREWWSHAWTLPPALGINWVSYPLTLLFLYRGLRKVQLQPETAFAACLLWGLSPPALDSLTLCYVPAKALMNLWFAMGLDAAAGLGVAAGSPQARPAALWRASLMLGGILLLAFLTDETSFIVCLVILVVFWRLFFLSAESRYGLLIAWAGPATAAALFFVTTFAVYPAVERAHAYVGLDYLSVVLHGPAVAYSSAPLGQVSDHLAEWGAKFNPDGVAFTMLSAHLIPNRHVDGFWTRDRPQGADAWPLSEAGAVMIFIVLLLMLMAQLPPSLRQLSARVACALSALILGYAILLVPVAPAIIEVNYYGALFSLPWSILLATAVVPGILETPYKSALRVVGLILLCLLEVGGYEATSERIRRNYSNYQSFWNKQAEQRWDNATLQSISAGVEAGRFEQLISRYPYPSRAFSYAFELEANRWHREHRPVDFAPMHETPSLYDTVIAQHNALLARNHLVLQLPALPSKAALIGAGGRELTTAECQSLIRDHEWTGQGRDWRFERTFAASGSYLEKRWLVAIMRVWQLRGEAAVRSPSDVSFSEDRGTNCIELCIVRLKALYYAFDSKGVCRFSFDVR